MSFRRAHPIPPATRRRHGRGGFTLVEVLVIIGIILLLLGILLPAVGRAWTAGIRSRMALDMQTIVTGLEAYQQDHKAYPRVTLKGNGSYMLCRTLIGADLAKVDGQDGPGFRTVRAPGPDGKIGTTDDVVQGRVWGPYLKPENWKFDSTNSLLLDRYSNRILYYTANKKADVYTSNGYVAASEGAYADQPSANTPRPYFNAADNDLSLMPATTLQFVMGADSSGKAVNPAFLGDYLIWSAGPDEKYGPKDKTKAVTSKNRCDDVANFSRGLY